jgi:anti-sigma B factor antagonist
MSHKTTALVTHRVTAREYLTVRQIRERRDLERIHPIGEIDLYTAPLLRNALANADHVPKVVVDLSQVEFLALVGVQVLQTASEQRDADGGRLVVSAPTPAVQRVLCLTNAAASLETYVSTSSAMSALDSE